MFAKHRDIVCSFDVGLSNLSVCVLQQQPDATVSILYWGVVDLRSKGDLHVAIQALAEHLDSGASPYITLSDVVVIEDQSTANVDMRVMSHAIQMYFVARSLAERRACPIITFVPAMRKFLVYNGPSVRVQAKNRYKRNKKLAVEHARLILSNDPSNLMYLMSLDKRDDAADAFLLGMYYMKHMTRGDAFQKSNKYECIPVSIDNEGDPLFTQENRICSTHPFVYGNDVRPPLLRKQSQSTYALDPGRAGCRSTV